MFVSHSAASSRTVSVCDVKQAHAGVNSYLSATNPVNWKCMSGLSGFKLNFFVVS